MKLTRLQAIFLASAIVTIASGCSFGTVEDTSETSNQGVTSTSSDGGTTDTVSTAASGDAASATSTSSDDTQKNDTTSSPISIDGSNGSISISGMSGTSFTVSYIPSKTITACYAYVSEGNGTGLIVSHASLSESGGTWSYTATSATFTAGSTVHVLLLSVSGGETCVPQGTLSDTTCASWSSFTFNPSGSSSTSSSDNGSSTTDFAIEGPCSVKVGSSITLTTSGSTSSTVTWTTSDSTRATVASGVVTGISAGSVVITATAGGLSAAKTISISTASSGGTSSSSYSSLVALASGKQMTLQFLNNTGGAYPDDQVYVCCIGLNESKVWCYLKPDGTLVPVGTGTSDSWSYKLSEVSSGFQVPYMASARLYISLGKKIVLTGTGDGVIMPNINNSSDANINTYFEWIEFSMASNGFWGNTTQVDQFGFPVTMDIYSTDESVTKIGITESRAEIYQEFLDEMPSAFDTLEGTYRIMAPCKGAFRTGSTYGSYMDDYVSEVWNYYKTHTATVNHPQGTFTLSGDGTNLNFYCTAAKGSIASVGTTYTISGKPDNNAVFEGSGVLATGNSMEKALEAWVCAALNRHVATNDPATWSVASTFYQAAPCNYFAKFWHEHNLGSLSYGFCYDDVADQSSTVQTSKPRGVVIGIGF